MLIACETCKRQYDVGDFAPGAQVRCQCGDVAVVPEPRPRQVRMLHCANCGGALPGEGKACSYCDAQPCPSEALLGGSCPGCFAQLAGDAPHCPGCGGAIDPQAVLHALSDCRCPSCKDVDLIAVEPREGAPFYECSECDGLWLSTETFARVARESAERALPAPLPDTVAPNAAPRRYVLRREKAQWRRCPVCTNFMKSEEFARVSGVRVDRCSDHGTWFDAGELRAIQDFIEQGRLIEARDDAEKRRRLAVSAARRGRIRRRREAREARAERTILDLLLDDRSW